MNTKHWTILPVVLIIGVIAFGTIGYAIIEKWDIFDAFYMAISTLTTVGYMEVHPLSKTGRIFTTFLILSGVGTMLYALSIGARVVLEGEMEFDPTSTSIIKKGDTLVAMGETRQLKALEDLVGG